MQTNRARKRGWKKEDINLISKMSKQHTTHIVSAFKILLKNNYK